MPFDSDVALLGTGVAPLIAASHLIAQGKSVLLLNPDLDFFLEDSELPMDPFLHGALSPVRILRNTPSQALSILRPDFPGAIEFWTAHNQKAGYHDPTAPHIRERDRLWISPIEQEHELHWNMLENLFVEAEDHGLNPQILEGFSAMRRFPGTASTSSNYRGLLIPKLCDIDIMRYRIGLMEFIRERLGPEKVICAVNQVDWMPGGIRFRSGKSLNTAHLQKGMLVFWTPRLTNWIINQARTFEVTPPTPKGVRLWEEWSLISREAPNPQVIGNFSDMAVWAHYEGPPNSEQSQTSRLSVLRSGPLASPESQPLPESGLNWASSDSFNSLARLCQGFLKWENTTIRGMKGHAIFEWPDESSWQLCKLNPMIQIVKACDGPLIDVVRVAKAGCDQLYADVT
jgi:hypothetical protein